MRGCLWDWKLSRDKPSGLRHSESFRCKHRWSSGLSDFKWLSMNLLSVCIVDFRMWQAVFQASRKCLDLCRPLSQQCLSWCYASSCLKATEPWWWGCTVQRMFAQWFYISVSEYRHMKLFCGFIGKELLGGFYTEDWRHPKQDSDKESSNSKYISKDKTW